MAECSALRAGCLVMAAGNASRFGENKLAARFDGQSLFSLALAAIPAEHVCPRHGVVSQYPALLEEASLAGFDTILNDRPEDGISRTIRLGTQAMADCAGILYMVADQPLLRAGTVRRVVDAWWANPDCIAAAAHNGKRGNPCLFPARFFPELCALEADRGGSSVIRRHEDALLLVEAGARAVRLRHKAGAGDPEGKRIAPLIPGAAGGAWRDR
ncbi:MAG: NTP transferase domain-containing protein [Acutalibacteraceae bacterium]